MSTYTDRTTTASDAGRPFAYPSFGSASSGDQGRSPRYDTTGRASSQRNSLSYPRSSSSSTLAGALGPTHSLDTPTMTPGRSAAGGSLDTQHRESEQLAVPVSSSQSPIGTSVQAESFVQSTQSLDNMPNPSINSHPNPPWTLQGGHMYSQEFMQNYASQSTPFFPFAVEQAPVDSSYGGALYGADMGSMLPFMQNLGQWGPSTFQGDVDMMNPAPLSNFQPEPTTWPWPANPSQLHHSHAINPTPPLSIMNQEAVSDSGERFASANAQTPSQTPWNNAFHGIHAPEHQQRQLSYLQFNDVAQSAPDSGQPRVTGNSIEVSNTPEDSSLQSHSSEGQGGEDAVMAPPPTPDRLQSFQTRGSVREELEGSLPGSDSQVQPTPEARREGAAMQDEINDGALTGRAATMGLGDAMWNQCNRHYRFSLNETFRLRHGREPPAEMRILETSALERSRAGDRKLRTALKTEQRESTEAAERMASDDQSTRREVGRGGSDMDVAHPSPRSPVPPTRNAPNTFMSDDNFFDEEMGEGWVPAMGGADLLQSQVASRGSVDTSVSPLSPELPTPSDVGKQAQSQSSEASARNDASGVKQREEVRSVALQQKVMPLLRHDGHLASHVSGLGGTFSEAYDGRSYLPDDAEPDPNHLIKPPPGARSGDHPLIVPIRPHPMKVHGQRFHRLMAPPPQTLAHAATALLEKKSRSNEDLAESPEEDEGIVAAKQAEEKEITEQFVEKNEQGDGWGFPEGGSHGEYDGGLLSEAEKKKKGASRPHLKLSTDKKVAPKMACLFCRQRKIACGPGENENTCNQCQKRALRCTFPSESRRGMRTRKTRKKSGVDNNDPQVDIQTPSSAEPPGDKAKVSGRRGRTSNGMPKRRGRPRDTSVHDLDLEDREEDEVLAADMGEQPSSSQLTQPNDPLSLFSSELGEASFEESGSFHDRHYFPSASELQMNSLHLPFAGETSPFN